MTGYRSRIALVGLCIVAGLALKAGRYGDRPEASLEAAVAKVEQFMGAGGWKSRAGVESRTGGLYPYLLFRKANCERPVVVAILGGNNESAELVRRDAGGDIAFVQNGEILAQPSGVKRQLSILTAGIANVLGPRVELRIPVLAVIPAPSVEAGICTGPSASAWQGFQRP